MNKIILGIVCLCFLIISSFSVSANFACGSVESEGDYLPAWFDVIVSYQENPEYKTSCKVSPANNKYCCDPLQISQVNWGIGKYLEAEILDTRRGYFAESVALSISGEGYDIFPEMQLKRAVRIISPDSKILPNDDSEIFVNVSSNEPFTNLSYLLVYENSSVEGELCDNCTNQEFYLMNYGPGHYFLSVFARDGGGEVFNDSMDIYLVDYMSTDFRLDCDGCYREFVPLNTRVNLTFISEFSHEVSGEMVGYFPNDWVFIDGEGVIEDYSSSHKSISWEVSGNKAQKNIILLSPSFYPSSLKRSYLGIQIERNPIEFYNLRLYSLFRFPFFLMSEKFSSESNGANLFNYVFASESNPAVLILEGDFVSEVAVFPKMDVSNVRVSFNSIEKKRRDYHRFSVRSTIPGEDIMKVMIKFRVNKNYLDDYVGDLLFYENGEDLVGIKTEVIREDDKYFYYEGFSDQLGIFRITKN